MKISRSRSLHALAFATLLLVWTWALLSPNPVPESLRKELSLDWEFVVSKALHAGMYTFLTVLGGTLARSWQGRMAVILFLVGHGVGTEIGQAVMGLGRHGCVRDGLIDIAGVAFGTIALAMIPLTEGTSGTRLRMFPQNSNVSAH